MILRDTRAINMNRSFLPILSIENILFYYTDRGGGTYDRWKLLRHEKLRRILFVVRAKKSILAKIQKF